MLYQRYIISNILEALNQSPVVIIIGARQTGKTTLVQHIASTKHHAIYQTLDDLTIRNAAKTDPTGYLGKITGPVVIDEIQLVPELFSAIKLKVDQKREPGAFLLTGSANVLTLPRISESLTGRMEIYPLYPLSQGELEDQKESFIDNLFSDIIFFQDKSNENEQTIWQRITNGGYPEIQKRSEITRKQAWFRDYVTTILQRDIRELANIEGLTQMPRLLELLALRISSMLNFAEISRTMQIPQTSMKRYIALFETTYLIYLLPSWSGNLGKRIVKTPKIFFTDTGLAAYLLGVDSSMLTNHSTHSGPIFENFVLSELLKQTLWSRCNPGIYHFRSQTGQKVDFILENRKRQCVGIEVKAASTVRSDDFKGLQWLSKELGKRFLRGIVLYTGQEFAAFGENLYALPVSALWQPGI